MKTGEYREYLQGLGVPDDAIEKQIAIVGDFVEFLTDLGLKEATAGKEEVERFARKLIAEERNTLENFSLLRDYANWRGYRKLYRCTVRPVRQAADRTRMQLTAPSGRVERND